MNYCLKGKELLLGLKRSEWLPPFDDEGVRVMLSEVDDLTMRMKQLTEASDDVPPELRITLAYYHQCLNRNNRYIDSYLHNRLVKIRNLRWEAGPVLPDSIRQDTLSTREKEYFTAYNALLSEVNESLDLDLGQDLEPPRDLFIEVRVLQDCGRIMTDSGPVNLDKGSLHCLKRSDVEQFVREGLMAHVDLNDEGQA
ncbi:hypothetical protein B484DRAFT_400647 [Ochromonadaceae sp. CCMP2298]|nr:hypothetical protein B484DRAFT_400647 [Ochromonadaceae sp. CCMP2298]